MIAETITNVANVLDDLRQYAAPEEAEVMRQACIVLTAAAEDARNLETLLPIAGTGEARSATPAAA
ncbi:MAG: hypothetical protein AUJ49_01580 [Desulfovibrionaceae bacterium CG1_02_65_16]|nr:MAG: hypothetical protein AUJ49_01580 [Desulfovibrionaceae bacterium CG1_02_65_16]